MGLCKKLGYAKEKASMTFQVRMSLGMQVRRGTWERQITLINEGEGLEWLREGGEGWGPGGEK